MKKFLSIAVCVLISFLSLTALRAEAATADWSVLSAGMASNEFNQISCPDAPTCYLVSGLYLIGGTGGIIKTSDGGTTFATLALPSSNPLHAIACPLTKTCFAAGDFGTLLKTTDGGETWSEIILGSKANPPELTGLSAIDANRVVVVGKDGFIVRTVDGGATWAPPSLRTFADFSDVYFSDSQTGFLMGNGGALFKTMNGGETWKPLLISSSTGSILAMRGAGGKTLYAVGDSLFKSTDNGDTWSELHNGLTNGYRTIAVPDEHTAYLISESNTVFKTTDGGVTWSSDFSPSGSTIIRSITCPTSMYCIAVGNSGKAFRLGTPPLPPPPPPPVVVAATTTTPLVATSSTPLIAAVAAAVQTAEPVVVLNRTLKKGSHGEDVKQLQNLLAAVGLFSQTERTITFGPATMKAVGKFQERYNIVKPGKTGYGEAGPKTRAKLIETAKAKKTVKPSTSE